MIKKAVSIIRKNSRIKINELADKLKINRSTFYDRFLYLHFFIKRFVTLIDFNKLGYFTLLFITKKDPCFLQESRVNNLYEQENNYLIEVLFRDLKELNNFNEKYDRLIIKKVDVLEIIKKEEFLSK